MFGTILLSITHTASNITYLDWLRPLPRAERRHTACPDGKQTRLHTVAREAGEVPQQNRRREHRNERSLGLTIA